VGHGLVAYATEPIHKILAECRGFVAASSVPKAIYADDRVDEISGWLAFPNGMIVPG